MCLAIPAKVTKIHDREVTIKQDGNKRQVDNFLIDDLKVGDWVLCHSTMVIQKMEPKEAKKILELVRVVK